MKDGKELKEAKANNRNKKFDYEEDKRIVNTMLDCLEEMDEVNSFDISSRALEKLYSQLGPGGP